MQGPRISASLFPGKEFTDCSVELLKSNASNKVLFERPPFLIETGSSIQSIRISGTLETKRDMARRTLVLGYISECEPGFFFSISISISFILAELEKQSTKIKKKANLGTVSGARAYFAASCAYWANQGGKAFSPVLFRPFPPLAFVFCDLGHRESIRSSIHGKSREKRARSSAANDSTELGNRKAGSF